MALFLSLSDTNNAFPRSSFPFVMGKTKDITAIKYAEVSTLLKNTNYCQRKIAAIANVSLATVNRIKSKLRKNETFKGNRIGKCGRRRLTTARSDRKIRDICLQNRKKGRKLLTKIIQESGIHLSERTIRRRLAEMGFKCCRPAKKPRLTTVMKQKRLEWARNHRHLTENDWKKVKINILFRVEVYNSCFILLLFIYRKKIIINFRCVSLMSQHSKS